VGFHSQKFSRTEQNYPIYNREFLAIMHGLRNWDYLLKGTSIPIPIYTNHANLRYYRDPRKIGPRVAGYLLEREQYNMLLEYKLGATNQADGLLRQEDHDDGSNPDNDNVTVWPDSYFCEEHTKIRIMDWDSLEDNLDQKVKNAQNAQQEIIKQWSIAHGLTLHDGTHWYHGNALVVVEDNDLRRGVTSLFHDQLTAGHPGISKTLQLFSPYY